MEATMQHAKTHTNAWSARGCVRGTPVATHRRTAATRGRANVQVRDGGGSVGTETCLSQTRGGRREADGSIRTGACGKEREAERKDLAWTHAWTPATGAHDVASTIPSRGKRLAYEPIL